METNEKFKKFIQKITEDESYLALQSDVTDLYETFRIVLGALGHYKVGYTTEAIDHVSATWER
jgi:hypothetical protein